VYRYDYHWLFPREFHVSPFNDRTGFYGISVVLPFDSLPSRTAGPPPPPRARVRVDLFTESTTSPDIPGPLKLIACIDPQTSVPFTSTNLRKALAMQPFVLLLGWSRILYNAWVLHYVKHLDVFLRPDPRPAIPKWSSSFATESAESDEPSVSGNGDATVRVLEKDNGAYTLSLDLTNEATETVAGGVGWQPESDAETFARKRVEDFLKRRVQELGVEVTFVPANPAIPQRQFRPSRFFSDEKEKTQRKLIISHMSSTVFATLFMTPGAEHALAMGDRENQFIVSDRELFLKVFAPAEEDKTTDKAMSLAQRMRMGQIPASATTVLAYPVPSSHPLEPNGTYLYLMTLLTLWQTFFFDWYTEMMYRLFGARFVSGQEPWGWRVWERVGERGSKMHEYLEKNVHKEGYIIGSVRSR
jgi:hypothetical protein